MFRGLCAGLIIVAGAQIATAQTTKPKSPAEIAAASEKIAEKREACRLEAKAQKLSAYQRHKYRVACLKRP